MAKRYLHGPVIDQILADEEVDSLISPGEVIWPLTDNLGTVRDLASCVGGILRYHFMELDSRDDAKTVPRGDRGCLGGTACGTRGLSGQ